MYLLLLIAVQLTYTTKAWNCVSTSLCAVLRKPNDKDIATTSPRIHVNHCYSILCHFEISQVSQTRQKHNASFPTMSAKRFPPPDFGSCPIAEHKLGAKLQTYFETAK